MDVGIIMIIELSQRKLSNFPSLAPTFNKIIADENISCFLHEIQMNQLVKVNERRRGHGGRALGGRDSTEEKKKEERKGNIIQKIIWITIISKGNLNYQYYPKKFLRGGNMDYRSFQKQSTVSFEKKSRLLSNLYYHFFQR